MQPFHPRRPTEVSLFVLPLFRRLTYDPGKPHHPDESNFLSRGIGRDDFTRGKPPRINVAVQGGGLGRCFIESTEQDWERQEVDSAACL